MKILANEPDDIPTAYQLYYAKMAEHFARLLRSSRPRVLLEAGCGRGQLTIPLLGKLPKETRIIGVDSSRKPYQGWLAELDTRISQMRFSKRVKLIKTNVNNLKGVGSASVDGIISNELLCDLTGKRQLNAALREFNRVLRPRGVMVHGEWSSDARDKDRCLVAEHQPSWSSDKLFIHMRNAGFKDIRITYFDTTIRFLHKAALEELRTWGASRTIVERNERLLRKEGLELPFEHIIYSRK